MGTAVPQRRPGAHRFGDNSTDNDAVSEHERATLLDEFLVHYRSTVFSGLSKREVDLLVFGLLIQTKQVDLNGSQQSISRFLRTPTSKVKSLIYETQLRDELLKGAANEVASQVVDLTFAKSVKKAFT